ncbi:MAG: DUF1302 family protein [Nevskiaceae bacterium]|nr:MAG: DUF1302 family protein [Nevskiaceae bacterium]
MTRAHAARWNLDSDWVVNFDSLVSVGAALRTSNPNCAFIGNDNGGCVGSEVTPLQKSDPSKFSISLDTLRLNQDDGDLNYKQWQPVMANTQWVADLAVRGPDGWSGLLRGIVNYDAAIGRTKRTDLGSKSLAVSNPRLLDAYISKNLDVFGHDTRIRVGNQVISWGESLFILGGINSINPIYVPGSHSAGTQLKTLFLPSQIVSINTSITDNLGVEAFYQWRWNTFTFDVPGTFFSTLDVLGKHGRGIYFPTSLINAALTPLQFPNGTIGDNGTTIVGRNPRTLMPYNRQLSFEELADPNANPMGPILGTGTVIARGADRRPKAGQGGAAFRYKFEDSGNELGFFYERYNDKTPYGSYTVVNTKNNPVGLELNLDYGTGRNLFGTSYSFLLGDWQLGTEFSYRPHDGVTIDPSSVSDSSSPYYCANYSNSNLNTPTTVNKPIGTYCRGWVDTANYQFQLSGLNIVSPSGPLGWILNFTGAKESILIAEASFGYYPELKLHQGIPYATTSNYALPTKTIAGAVLFGSLTFPNIFGTRAALTPDFAVSQGIHGYPATPLPGFIQGAGSATFGLNFDFKVKPATTMRLDYTQNWGAGAANLLRDRNFMSVSITTAL